MDPAPLFGADFIGKTLVLRPTGDPPGGWAYELDQEPVAELSWSRHERAVRMETEVGVCRIRFSGLLRLRGEVVVGEDQVVLAGYRGGLAGGRALVGLGRPFDFFSQLDRQVGPWRGIDDVHGIAVVRIRPNLEQGISAAEVVVTPRERYAPFIGPLLALFGGLQVIHRVRPWLGITTVLSRGG